MIPLVYHPGYNIKLFGLERLHPFDGRKFEKIQRELVALGLRRPADFAQPEMVTDPELLEVHTPAYLNSSRQPGALA